MEDFEIALSGGHPNSLGRTLEVVDVVLADRSRLADFASGQSSTQWTLALLFDLLADRL